MTKKPPGSGDDKRDPDESHESKQPRKAQGPDPPEKDKKKDASGTTGRASKSSTAPPPGDSGYSPNDPKDPSTTPGDPPPAPQEPAMSYDYSLGVFDTRNLRGSLTTAAGRAAYKAVVEDILLNRLGVVRAGNDVVYGFVLGTLLLQERFETNASDFVQAVDDARKITFATSPKRQIVGTPGEVQIVLVPNKEYIAAVADALAGVPGHGTVISFQELAFVSQFTIDRANEVPLGDPNFGTQVRVGLDRFIGGDPLSLPVDLGLGDEETGEEIVPENVFAFAKVFRAYYMEQLRIIDVVDRIVELWHNGLLAIGDDNAGRALDAYAFTTEDFFSPAARQMTYARMLGAPAGEVSKEVQPNREFEQRFMRFITSVAELDRQRHLDEILRTGVSALSLTDEQVRKSGRDLAANCSLYGWGGAHFAARRLEQQLSAAVGILKQPSILRAYGVTNALQVIERVTAREFGSVPNIVKFRTMAESGLAILEIVARNSTVWVSASDDSLFGGNVIAGSAALRTSLTPGSGSLPIEDQRALIRHTQFILAVQGVPQEQVDRLSQPVDAVYAPSVPSFDGISVAPASADGATATIERIRQMVSTGTPPTIDQLNQLLPAGR